MDPLEVLLIVGLAGCFLGAAGLSAVEVAILRVRRTDVLVAAKRGEGRWGNLLRIVDDLPLVLNTVLLLILLLQVAAATIGGFLAARWFGGLGVSVVTVVLTLLLFVYAEAIPKTRAVASPTSTALRATPLLLFLLRLFRPLVSLLIRLAGLEAGAGVTTVGVLTEAEIRVLARESALAGEIAEDDAELVDRSFTFNDRSIAEVMVPWSDVTAVDAGAAVADALSLAIAAGHRRLPVYRNGPNDVIGVVRLRDLASRAIVEPTAQTSSTMTRPLRCRESDLIRHVLDRMQMRGGPFAIVSDDVGQVSGLVTVEDIVAELVGEFAEDDRPEHGDLDSAEVKPVLAPVEISPRLRFGPPTLATVDWSGEDDGMRATTKSMQVADVMTADPITLTVSDPVDRARDVMLTLGIHGIPIVDDVGDPVGIVTSHDLVDDWIGHEALAEVMTQGVTTIDQQATIVEAAELMKSHFNHHLLVVADRRMVGILTTFDLMDALLETETSAEPDEDSHPANG